LSNGKILTIELQKLSEELERICAGTLANQKVESRRIEDYLKIRNLHEVYPFKHSLWSSGACYFPCNSRCYPRLENETFMSKEAASKLRGFESKSKIYTNIDSNFNNICFPRCGNSKDYPTCDKSGTIDVRLLSHLDEFESYYLLRPDFLLQRDADFHPETLEMHEILRTIFESKGKSEVVKKVDFI
jgi:hypothetical protein